jgi:hypothetical protein
MGFQRLQSADLIGLHEPAVPDDIGGQNCGKSALKGLVRHDPSHRAKLLSI